MDVGVPAYAFLCFFLNSFSSLRLLLRLSRLIFLLVGNFRFRFGEVAQSVRLDSSVTIRFSGWVEWMMRGFDCSVSCSLSPLELSGGGLC